MDVQCLKWRAVSGCGWRVSACAEPRAPRAVGWPCAVVVTAYGARTTPSKRSTPRPPQARSELRAGRLLAAADTLARAAAGSEAAGAVEGWVRDARARALADQNARLLHAHATSTAAALA